MRREVYQPTVNGNPAIVYHYAYLNVTGANYDLYDKRYSSFSTFTNTVTNVGNLTIGDIGLQGDYQITSKPNFMPNTYTDASNITYSWTQGNGW
jgi:hypothetical protein